MYPMQPVKDALHQRQWSNFRIISKGEANGFRH